MGKYIILWDAAANETRGVSERNESTPFFAIFEQL